MPNTLTYQQKCILALVCFILFMLLAYKFSFSKTFTVKAEIGEKEKKIQWLKEKEKEIPFLKAKMDLIEKSYAKDSLSIRDRLTAFISDYAENNDCLVTEIPSFTAYKNSNLQVQTNVFTIRGRFIPLLKLVQEVENRFKTSAKLMSVHFMAVKDFQSKKKNLYLTLITQSFNQTKQKND